MIRRKSIRYSRPRIFNVCEISTFQIRQNYPAPVGFLPEPDFCQIWKSAGFRPEPKSGTALIFSRSALLDSKNGFNYCTATLQQAISHTLLKLQKIDVTVHVKANCFFSTYNSQFSDRNTTAVITHGSL